MDEIKKGQELIVFLTKIYEEAFSVQKERRKKYEEYTSYYHGQIWPKDSHRLKIVINHLKEIITRKVSLMTDVIPVIELLPSDERLFPVAEALKKVITALWEEYSWSDTLQELIYFNQLYGSAFTNTCWDPALDWGKGDINIIVGDPRSYLIDPFITRANKINEAEYIIYEYFKPTEQLRAQYPDAAEEIKSYYEIEKEKKGFMDRILKTLKFRTESGFRPTIERSLVKEYWIKDRTVQNDKAVYPAGRFIKLVGNTILDDEPNIYWDGRFPIDMIDWQFDPDSPFGISEVEDLATPFKVYNNILSLIVENTVLSVNTIWTGDIDSLPPGEREKLLRNKPGEFIGHRPGKPIVRQPPPPLPAYLMANVEYLRSMLDEVSGMAEVTRGKRGGLTSASALEGAFLASQSIIRYQARKLENLISRIGQKLIARILQFFTDDRLMFITGPEGRDQFHFVRNEIIKPFQDVYAREINGIPSEQIPTYLARRAFRDFQFKVIAGSSLAMTKTQRAMLAMTLFKLGIIDDESVLDILEFPNKKAILYRKRTGKGEAPPPRSKVKLPVMRTDRGLPSRKGMGFGL